ncbi:lamin tail domain-containing protein [Candidatus Parcubacteria bacterium]|nr:lamin tail domain-containing protein [Patescibacteria group bacterium]MCG2686636.1 lamin tail domain-containing protein [Candidatus Parcubacteria bacterium]
MDLVLNSENDFAPKITPTIPSLKNITVENQGSLDFQYKIRVENINGNLDLCSELNLSDFNLATTTLLTGTNDNLNYTANLANNNLSLQNKTCAFDLVFTSWQENLTDENSGFFDKETISNVVESDEWGDENVGVVLNEFLPNPQGEEYGFDFGIDTSIKPQGEWIELYNNSNNTVDLTGYYLTDASGDRIDIESCRTNTGNVQILSHDYLVVYRSAGGTCNSHNFELNNNGDTIYFYNSLDELQDTTNYTGNDYCDLEPTPGEENDETGSGTCSGVPPNKSYARIPDGVGAWVDPIPTPGGTNSIQEQAVIPNDL